MELFTAAVHGKPGTHLGEIEVPDGLGEHGSIACGDALRFTFKVEKDTDDPKNDRIIEAKYLTFGCTSAIAASEALCCIIEEKHLTPIEALKITNQDIIDYLEGLPGQKIHCSVMGAEALQVAVFDWAKKRGVNFNALGIDIHADEQEEGRMVCKCFTLTEPYIKRKIKELSLRTIPAITQAIKAGGACMSCQYSPGGLQDLLDKVWGTERKEGYNGILPVIDGHLHSAESKPQPVKGHEMAQPSPFQFARKIEKVLENHIRPLLQQDGGDLELIDIKETMVYLGLRGACADCAGAGQTLKHLIERTLKEQVDERIRVVQV